MDGLKILVDCLPDSTQRHQVNIEVNSIPLRNPVVENIEPTPLPKKKPITLTCSNEDSLINSQLDYLSEQIDSITSTQYQMTHILKKLVNRLSRLIQEVHCLRERVVALESIECRKLEMNSTSSSAREQSSLFSSSTLENLKRMNFQYRMEACVRNEQSMNHSSVSRQTSLPHHLSTQLNYGRNEFSNNDISLVNKYLNSSFGQDTFDSYFCP